jgi:hypothetical protein
VTIAETFARVRRAGGSLGCSMSGPLRGPPRFARRSLRSGGVFAMLLASAAVAEDAKPIPPFSADVELRAEGEVVQKWRLESSGERIRVTPLDNDELETSLVDLATKRVWTFAADGKGCQVANSADPLGDVLGSPAETEGEELLGEEKVAGIATRKLRLKSTDEGPAETTIVWRAPELGGIPIRTLRPADRVELVYRRISREAPAAGRFETPKGCPAE